MDCSTNKIVQSIIRQFSADNPCGYDLTQVVPAFWELAERESCFSNELRALLTKRELVLFLLGCQAYSSDFSQFDYSKDASTVSDTVSNTRAQAQSTGNSTRFQRGQGETKYSDASNSNTLGTGKRVMRGTQVGDSVLNFSDDGRGNGFNNSLSTSNRNESERRATSYTIDAIGGLDSLRRDCNYEYSTNNTDGKAFVLPVIPISIGLSFTGTGSEWRKYTKQFGLESEEMRRDTATSASASHFRVSTSNGVRDWQTFFTADVKWHERYFDIVRRRDRHDHRRDTEAHFRGSGNGINEDKTNTHNAEQGTGLVEARSDTLRIASSVSNTNFVSLSNSQRFTNLRNIYDQLTERIALLKRRLRSTSKPSTGQMCCDTKICLY